MKHFHHYLKALKKYADFSGRSERYEFWYFVLFNLIISSATGFLSSTLSGIYFFAVLVPSIAVGVRRMHDIGRSGWYLLIPFYNLYLMAGEGETGANEYGEEPFLLDE